jgi:hypothetical protein
MIRSVLLDPPNCKPQHAQRGAFLSGRRPARLSTAAVAASVASGAAALMASAAACGNSFPVIAAPAAACDLTILHPRGALRSRSDLHYAAEREVR